MKKILVLTGVLIMLAAGVSTVYAEQGFGVYMGAGGSYAFEILDVDQYNGYYVDEYGVSPDFDSTYGFYALVGARIPIPEKFRVARMFCFEIEGNYMPGFDWSGKSQLSKHKGASIEMELDVTTITGAIKFDPKIGDMDIFRPYLLVGGGLMIGEINTTASFKGRSASGGNTEYDPCAKVGLGFDYYLTESLSVNMEGTYVTGFHDLDEVRYFNTSLGLALHM
ncbi:MAG: outer membrane beta-barrel protein [Desulfatibacillum sp.]|nr:outer membrane beta-barrel protein [Desulfatibacillum sp.]